MAQENILSISLKEYKTQLDDLRASLAQLEKGSKEYEETANEIKERQQRLNEAMSVGKRDSDALEGSYNALSKEMSALKKEWKATNDEAKRNELGQQIDALNSQLKDMDASIGVHNRNVGDYSIAGESMKSQLRSIQEEMANMLANGVSPTDKAFMALQNRAGQLKDAMADASSMVSNASDDFRGMSTAIDVVKTGASAFGVLSSAMAVFGVENDKVAQSIQKLMAIQTLLSSLNELQKSFDTSTKSGQFFHGILEKIGLAKSVDAKATEEQVASEVANTTATVANTTAKTAQTGAQAGSTTATGANTTATVANTAAQTANATAVGLGTKALNLFKKALISTGIGAFVVLLGALVANWDKVTASIRKAVGLTDNYTGASENAKKAIEQENKAIDDEVRLMKAQGVSEAKIIEFKKKKVKAQIEEIKGKITDIEATKKQMQTANKWYKVIKEASEKALNGITLMGRGVLWIFDKIFGSDWAGAFEKMVKGWSKSLADWAMGVSDMDTEIEGLQGQLEQLQETSHNLDIDEQCNKYTEASKKATQATKDLADAQKKGHEAYKKAIQEELDLTKDQYEQMTKTKELLNKLKEIKGFINDEDKDNFAIEKLDDEEKYLKTLLTKYKKYASDEKLTVDERKEYAKKANDTEAKLNENKLQKMLAREQKYTNDIKREHSRRLKDISDKVNSELDNLDFKDRQIQVGIVPTVDFDKLKIGDSKELFYEAEGLQELGQKIRLSLLNISEGFKDGKAIIPQEIWDKLSEKTKQLNEEIRNSNKELEDFINNNSEYLYLEDRVLQVINDIPNDIYEKYKDLLEETKKAQSEFTKSASLDMCEAYAELIKEIDETEFKNTKNGWFASGLLPDLHDYQKDADTLFNYETQFYDTVHNLHQEAYDNSIAEQYKYINRLIAQDTTAKDLRTAIAQEEDEKKKAQYEEELKAYNDFTTQYTDAFVAFQNAKNDEEREKQQERLDNLLANNRTFADAEMEIEALRQAKAEETADYIIKQQERIQKKRKEDAKNTNKYVGQVVNSFNKLNQGVGKVFGSISDLMTENLNQKIENGEISEQEAEKEFERIKKIQVAEAIINTIAGGVGIFTSTMKDDTIQPSWLRPVLAGTLLTAEIIAGMAQVKQIQNTKFDGGGSGSSASGGGGATMAAVQPLLNEDVDSNNMTAMSASVEAGSDNSEIKVVVLESDITNTQNNQKTRVSQTTF